jgi:hypothetical protein
MAGAKSQFSIETVDFSLSSDDCIAYGLLSCPAGTFGCRSRTPKILLTSGYDAEMASAQDTTASDLKVLRNPYRQADLARVLGEILRDWPLGRRLGLALQRCDHWHGPAFLILLNAP